MANQIKAVTLHRPWGHAVARLGKNIENRSWNCYLKPGDFLAIHNGAKWDKAAVDFIRGIHPGFDLTKDQDPAKAVIAVAMFGGNITESGSPWFMGKIGWLLEDVVAIDPVPCNGQQGLWSLPPDVLTQVRANYSKAILVKEEFDG